MAQQVPARGKPLWATARAVNLARVGCWASTASREMCALSEGGPTLRDDRPRRAPTQTEWDSLINGIRLAQPRFIQRINAQLVDAPTVEQHACWLVLDERTSLAKSEAVRSSALGGALVSRLMETKESTGRRHTLALRHPLDAVTALAAEVRLARHAGDSERALDCSLLLAREVVYLSLDLDYRIPFKLVWRALQLGVLSNLGHPVWRVSRRETCMEDFVEAIHSRWAVIVRLAGLETRRSTEDSSLLSFAIALFEPMVHLLSAPGERPAANLRSAIRRSELVVEPPGPRFAKFQTHRIFEEIVQDRARR